MTDLTVEKAVEFLRGALERGEVEEATSEHPEQWSKPVLNSICIRFKTEYLYRTKPRKVEGWVNVYPTGEVSWFSTEDEARKYAQGLPVCNTVYVCEPE